MFHTCHSANTQNFSLVKKKFHSLYHSMDSSLHSLHCSGKADSEDCLCRRFTQIPSQDPNQPALCHDCRHPEGYHPLPTSSIAGIVSAYKDASRIPSLKTSTSLKASMSTAKQESNSGLKRKHAGDEDKPWASKKTKVNHIMTCR
jgi:hypothetical protein